jgi:DNA-binding NarL/FixJ family response regulator
MATCCETAIRVLLIGHCGGLRSRLYTRAGMRKIEVVGEYRTGVSALALGLRHNPQIVLMELDLPNRCGLRMCRDILMAAPDVRVIFVSSNADDEHLQLESIFAGADGCLSKDIEAAPLLDACARVAAGHPIVDLAMLPALLKRIRAGVVRARSDDALTPQEQRILQLVAQGRTNKEIADMLGLSAKTVKNYLSNVYQKLHVTSRTQAAILFSQSGAR